MTAAIKEINAHGDRKFYSEPLDHIGRKEFVEMMLLDGCFIIELTFHSSMKKLLTNFYMRKAMRDLLLVENQLPFSVLSKLHSLSSCLPLDIAKARMADEAIRFFGRMMPGSPINALTQNQDVKHLLGLLHDLSYSSEEVKSPHELIDMFTPEMVVQQCSAAIVSFPRSCDLTKWQFIRSATELNEAGIKFQKNQGKLFDIKFQKEVMSIPTLVINDDTESILRNLVAYEQYYRGISSKCFTDYITFMDGLISTGKDVELLCHSGVLDNWLGDHEVVATMFNRLRDSVLISEAHFFYPEVLIRVNEHCNRKWNLWKENLWHNYFFHFFQGRHISLHTIFSCSAKKQF
ncbi:hypothetical protein SLEP1_g38479 [Rubroshorea leprosula]|nr:hypothetical protein SLEP1_g38479 [Rubroshorea leprosula]